MSRSTERAGGMFGVPIIDTMIGFPHNDVRAAYAQMRRQIRDRDTLDNTEMPVEYMFRAVPESAFAPGDAEARSAADAIAFTLAEMDRFGVDLGLVSVGPGCDVANHALALHPDRFIGSHAPDPNRGMDAVRDLVMTHAEFDVRAATFFPSGFMPQVPIDDRRMYPLYAKCVELDIAVFVCAGIAGPRLPSAPQQVERIDNVLYDFPELTFVIRHGAEPWVDLAVKLMVKWPNLHYSTSAFAPRYYPEAVIDYANTRGADRVIYGGYFPMGLSLERIMGEMGDVPFKDEVWPRFLRGNAARVLKVDRS